MKISHDKIERLIFVKHLLHIAEENILRKRPHSSVAVLILHDAVECFLQLVYEQIDGRENSTGNNILKFYSLKINAFHVEKKKNTINLEYIKRINELRNQLKHSTIFIDHTLIQNLFIETNNFISDYTKLVFNLNIKNVSIIDIVDNVKVEDLLRDAQDFLDKEDLKASIISVAKAYCEIDPENINKQDFHGDIVSQKHHARKYTYLNRIKGNNEISKSVDSCLNEVAKDINRIHEDLYELKKALCLPVELKDFLVFKSIIPTIQKDRHDSYILWNEPDESLTRHQVEFCNDFVVDLALKLC